MCTAASGHACPFHDACLVCLLHACCIMVHHIICIHCGLCSKALPIHCEEVIVTILLCSSACMRCLHFRLSRCQHRCFLLHEANAYCCFAGCFFSLFLLNGYLFVSSPTSSMPSMSSSSSPSSCHVCKTLVSFQTSGYSTVGLCG